MLDFVCAQYEDILLPAEQEFIRRFATLNEDAQCLFVRFCNRKGYYFRTQALCYPEIEDLGDTLNQLFAAGFLRSVTVADEPDAWLSLFTKTELQQAARRLETAYPPPSSMKKGDLVRWLVHTYDTSVLLEVFGEQDRLVSVAFQVEVMMFRFLFFGNRHAGQTEFVVRDLGHVRFENYDESQLTRRFSTRAEVEQSLMISLTKEAFYQLRDALPPEEVFDWFMNWQASIGSLSDLALPAFGRFVNRVGAWLERQKLAQQALNVYQLTDQLPARERRTRLLHKLGLLDEARALCEEIQADPQSAEELYFAKDFWAKCASRSKRVVRHVTHALNRAEVIELPWSSKDSVEQKAIAYYEALGYEAFFAENEPWRAFFGLLFWDIIHDTQSKAIHHPLQRLPSDFFLPDFYQKRKLQLLQRCQELHTKEVIDRRLEGVLAKKWGTTNALVCWYEQLPAQLFRLTACIQPEQIQAILLEMAKNLRENTRGFPDLLIWKSNYYQLVEIKSPSDHLSAQQLHWQYFFEKINVNSAVVRVKWQQPD